ncbi:MAG: DUF2953 domain-containing protein [Ruminiclostridium sp.]|nr:DUF2953 domain-containing protein [Ruminiclostridium sp.]
MTGWIVFGAILLVLILIFAQSVTVTAIYDRNPEVRVKILCFTIVKVPPDPEKEKRKAAKKAAKEEKKRRKEAAKAAKEARKHPSYNHALLRDAEENEPSEHKPTDPETKSGGAAEKTESKAKTVKPPKRKKKKSSIPGFEMIRDYIASASPPVKRLFRKIRIRDVYIDYVVGSDDAAKTALKYGGLCTAIYSLFEWLTVYMDTKIGEINIEADFSAEKDDIFAYITLKLRISTAVGCVLWLAYRMLRTYLKYNNKPSNVKARPARARMKG